MNRRISDIIGLHGKIISSKNYCDVGIQGIIIYESKNMIYFKDKKIAKRNILLIIEYLSEKILINGSTINNNICTRKNLC